MRKEVTSFNNGEVTEQIDSRSDIEKYANSCRILENMIPRIYGPAEERPGTTYIAKAKYTPQGIRLIPFIYSADISYMMEFGDLYARFFYNGLPLKTLTLPDIVPIEIATPYLVADLPALHKAQVGDVMRIVHEDYAPRSLSRTSAIAFNIEELTFVDGPFRTRNDLYNDDGITLTMVGTMQTIGQPVTLTAVGGDVFDNLHVGALFQLTYPRDTTIVTQTGTGTSSPISVDGTFTFVTHGTWTGDAVIQRKEGDSAFEDFRTYTAKADRNVQFSYTEKSSNVQYQIVATISSGDFEADLTVDDTTLDSIVKITAVASATSATGTIISPAPATFGQDATYRWAEGSWSNYRGYPSSITFFESRAIYLGMEDGLVTAWFSVTDDFENMKAGVDDSDAFVVTIPSTNDARWIDGLEALAVGTSGDEWRIQSNRLESPITPTTFTVKQQTTYGSDKIQPTRVNDAILYTDFVSKRVREYVFSDVDQKYVSPDLTALAEHITNDGLVATAYQGNPDPILWTARSDGQFPSMTYERDQGVVAWSRHLAGWTTNDSTETDSDTTINAYPTLQELTPDEIPDEPSGTFIDSVVAADGETYYNLPFDNGDSANPIAVDDAISVSGYSQNDFSADTDCMAVWNFDSTGELNTDSQNSNTLTPSGTPTCDTSDKKQGAGSVDVDRNDKFTIADAALTTDYPFSNGDTNKKISVAAWVKYTSWENNNNFYYAKHDGDAGKRSLSFGVSNNPGPRSVAILQGYNSGASTAWMYDDSVVIALNQWYHIAITYDDSTKTAIFRIYDDNASTTYTSTDTFVNATSVNDSILTIGDYEGSSGEMAGRIDEIAVFKDILTSGEIDEIRAGTYGDGSLSKTGVAKGIVYDDSATGTITYALDVDAVQFDDDDVITNGADTVDANGTPNSSIAVSDATGLQAMSGANSYLLTSDINLSGETWTPITSFSGTLDGDGYTISNLSIVSSSDNLGIFGDVADGFSCKDVNFNNCSISATDSDNCGILLGTTPGTNNTVTITNVHLTDCTVLSTEGESLGTLCGNLIAQDGSYISECTTTNAVVGGVATYGGLIGSYVLATTPVASDPNSYLVNCSAVNVSIVSSGTTTSITTAGGLVGYGFGAGTDDSDYDIILHTCYSTGTIILAGGQNVGGLIGFLDNTAQMTTCYSTVDITFSSTDPTDFFQDIGGLIGEESTYTNYTNCYATGDITLDVASDTTHIGGFFGNFTTTDHVTMLRCYSTGNVSVTTTGQYNSGIGGFMGTWRKFNGTGQLENLDTISRCWAEGDVTITAPSGLGADVGGFIGRVYSSDATDKYFSGGIHDCYTWSEVNITNPHASDNIGGFIGYFFIGDTDAHFTFDNCYVAQTDTKYGSGFSDTLVYSSANTGGFVGTLSVIEPTASVTVTESFWDKETSGLVTTSDTGSLPETTDWLQTKSNFESAGWQFLTIWVIESITNFVEQDADGVVSSVAVMPGMPDSGEDEVWVAVLRNIGGTSVRFIERMQPRKFATQADCYFVDCGVFYDGDAITTITGLDHLEGETVSILGDGADYGDMVVSNGSVVLPTAVSKASVGLPFRYKLKPMRLDSGTRRGASHGMVKKIGRLFLSFIDTLMTKQGVAGNLYDIDWRTEENYDSPPELFTGDRTIDNFDGGFSPDDPILITGDRPFPCTLRSIVVDTDYVD